MAPSRWLLPLMLVLPLVASAGCLQDLDDPSRSFSSIPTIIVDYDPEEGLTKLWVMSVLSHIRYENITLEITPEGKEGQTWHENFTYSAEGVTNATSFEVDALASTEDRDFQMEFHVELETDPQEGLVFVMTVPPPQDQPLAQEEEYDVPAEDLPWKKTMQESNENAL